MNPDIGLVLNKWSKTKIYEKKKYFNDLSVNETKYFMMSKIKKFTLFIFIIIFILMGCSKKRVNEELYITLPQTKTPITMNQWGVTKYDLLKFREKPLEDSKIINYLKLGSILEIIKKGNQLTTFDGFIDYWYYVNHDSEKGWIFGAYIHIYKNHHDAIKKSEQYIFNIDDQEQF